jgi:hypothetical protein
MSQKLLRSADQSLPYKHSVDKKKSLQLFIELWFDNIHSFNDLRHSSVYRKGWQGFITPQFATDKNYCRSADFATHISGSCILNAKYFSNATAEYRILDNEYTAP